MNVKHLPRDTDPTGQAAGCCACRWLLMLSVAAAILAWVGRAELRCAHISQPVGSGMSLPLVQSRNHPASICPSLFLPNKATQILLYCSEWENFKGKITQCRSPKSVNNINPHSRFLCCSLFLRQSVQTSMSTGMSITRAGAMCSFQSQGLSPTESCGASILTSSCVSLNESSL